MKKILILLLLLTMTGCNGSREPEERDYVMVVAIDKSYDTYVSIARPSEDNSASPKEETVRGEGNSISESLADINKKSKGQLYFGHTVACIADENILKDSRAVDEIITVCRNSTQFSRTILLFSTDNVQQIMNTHPDNATVSEYISDYMNVNRNIRYDINDMIKAVTHNREITPPTIRTENNAVIIAQGSA